MLAATWSGGGFKGSNNHTREQNPGSCTFLSISRSDSSRMKRSLNKLSITSNSVIVTCGADGCGGVML